MTDLKSKTKLAIITSHAIQYNAPWFALLAKQPAVDLHVFYTWQASENKEIYDPGFGKTRSWDIPLLEGYNYTFVKNVSHDQGTHHYKGLDNPTLIKQIEEWGAEAVLIIGWPFKSHFAAMRHFKGKIPVLFRGDSTLLDETGGLKKMVRRIMLTYVYSFIDTALYVGSNNKAYFLAHGLKEKELVFCPHAIDNDRFSNADDERNKEAISQRNKLGIGSNDFVVLFAGKLEHKKNPEFIIRLSKLLTDSKYKFVIVGNGPMEVEVKSKAGTDKRIVFVDFQNQQNMPVVYRMATVFILPSKGPGETWGLALNEAMACKRPVVATDKTGGAIDLINENGIIINSHDVSTVATYLSTLAADASKLKTAGEKSFEIIQRFSFNGIVSGICKALESYKSYAIH